MAHDDKSKEKQKEEPSDQPPFDETEDTVKTTGFPDRDFKKNLGCG